MHTTKPEQLHMDLVFHWTKRNRVNDLVFSMDMQTINKDSGTWQNTMPLAETK